MRRGATTVSKPYRQASYRLTRSDVTGIARRFILWEEKLDRVFASFANATAHAAGRPVTFLLCVAVVILWAISGPFFGFSENWQLIINTGTTIVTFLMVFLIQNSQNRDGAALQTKLDELIRSSKAENAFVGIEKLTDKELDVLQSSLKASVERHDEMLKRTKSEREARRTR
jgi:low affinity Fe/Cu permease